MTDDVALQERLRELEAENARLKTAGEARSAKPGARRLRNFGAIACIVIAAMLIPVGVLVGWAQQQMLDEERFIATFAPLAGSPAIQEEIVDQSMALIDREIDLEAMTGQVFDGVAALGLSENATTVLNLLRQPAAEGVRTMLERGVTVVVESDAFSGTWEQALRVSHRAFVAAVTSGDVEGQALSLSDEGEIAIQLGPIVTAVKAELVERGFGLASAIPEVNASIPVATTEALPMLRLVVTLTTIVGWWLPVVIVGLLAAGVALAPRRSRAVLGAGIGLMLGAALVLIAFEAAAAMLTLQAPAMGVGAEALAVLFAQIVADMRAQAGWILALGIILALVGWLSGASRPAAAVRAWFAGLWVRLGLTGSSGRRVRQLSGGSKQAES